MKRPQCGSPRAELKGLRRFRMRGVKIHRADDEARDEGLTAAWMRACSLKSTQSDRRPQPRSTVGPIEDTSQEGEAWSSSETHALGGSAQGHTDGRCNTNTSHWSIPYYQLSQPASYLVTASNLSAALNMSASLMRGKEQLSHWFKGKPVKQDKMGMSGIKKTQVTYWRDAERIII